MTSTSPHSDPRDHGGAWLPQRVQGSSPLAHWASSSTDSSLFQKEEVKTSKEKVLEKVHPKHVCFRLYLSNDGSAVRHPKASGVRLENSLPGRLGASVSSVRTGSEARESQSCSSGRKLMLMLLRRESRGSWSDKGRTGATVYLCLCLCKGTQLEDKANG